MFYSVKSRSFTSLVKFISILFDAILNGIFKTFLLLIVISILEKKQSYVYYFISCNFY